MTAHPRRKTLPDHCDIDIDVPERVLSAHGAVHAFTAPLLIAAARSLLSWRPGDLFLDLSTVTSTDAALLRAIREIRAAQRPDIDELRLINASTAVKRFLLASGSASLLRDTPDPVGDPLASPVVRWPK